uniref:Uncharacterized protein n=1 Tax=Arundo donax TaxID=35708 RepID=A0A0A9HIL0_ARUDO
MKQSKCIDQVSRKFQLKSSPNIRVKLNNVHPLQFFRNPLFKHRLVTAMELLRI